MNISILLSKTITSIWRRNLFVKVLPCTQREKNHTVDCSQINEAKQLCRERRELPFQILENSKDSMIGVIGE